MVYCQVAPERSRKTHLCLTAPKGKTGNLVRAEESGIGTQWVAVSVTNCKGSHNTLAQESTTSHQEKLLQTSILPERLTSPPP